MDTEAQGKLLASLFKRRIKDVTVAEKARMSEMMVGRGRPRRADRVAPNAVHIVRRQIKECRAPANTRGLERSIKTHLTSCCLKIKSAAEVTTQEFNQPRPATFHCPAPQGRAMRGRHRLASQSAGDASQDKISTRKAEGAATREELPGNGEE